MSLGVVVGAAVVEAFLTIRDPSSDMPKILVSRWGTALGNVIGFYFGARSTSKRLRQVISTARNSPLSTGQER